MSRLVRSVVVVAVIITSAQAAERPGSAGGERPSVELRAGLRAVDHAGAGALGEAADARRDRLGEQGGAKAARITDFCSRLAARPEVRGFLWFNHDKEADWRVQSSDASRIAYAEAVAASRYV